MSYPSSSEDEPAGPSLEELFEGPDSDDDVARPAPAHQEDDDDGANVADIVRTTPLHAEPVPASLAVEPGGHVNADGILYREPRHPFTGTLWHALLNAFIRIGVGNRRLPTGGRPQGYI